ncbi:AAA domain-containing protein [Verrucomicrobium sp. GAS474]|uniref:ATP-binding protein n=1 Tax=Verrucomicrobium sp. GAS474 TaxID=1882831 RepID=UPI00087D4371|nr:ATP-binding protein [Verrucomicrobium sp. GAS474]SDU28960.1 AAA domain-containing protein [Verrucomicrobium sp. GAS474]
MSSDLTHPVETTNYVVTTTEIEKVGNAVLEWAGNRCPGGIVHGPQRTGKSRAIRFLSAALRKVWPKLFVVHFPCKSYQTRSESAFFSDLLKAAGHSLFDSGNIAKKRDRLTEFLADKALSAGEDRIVIFADDAQRLSDTHYEWLMDIQNELQLRNVSLITILVGQPNLLEMRTMFSKSKQKQIVGRFMVHVIDFHGLRSAKDVKRCLKSFDEETEHPPGSGRSYPCHYFPAAWKKGWRLSSLSDPLWEAIGEAAREGGIKRVKEVPMQYFCRVIENILRRHGPPSSAEPNITHLMLKDAVNRSGLIDALAFE